MTQSLQRAPWHPPRGTPWHPPRGTPQPSSRRSSSKLPRVMRSESEGSALALASQLSIILANAFLPPLRLLRAKVPPSGEARNGVRSAVLARGPDTACRAAMASRLFLEEVFCACHMCLKSVQVN